MRLTRYAIVEMRTRWQRLRDRLLRRRPGRVLAEGDILATDISATQTPADFRLSGLIFDHKTEEDR